MTSHIDNALKSVMDFFAGTVQRFVTFLFVLFALGALYGAIFIQIDPLFLFLPALLALLAYFSRTFAFLILIGVLVFLFI